MHANLTLEDQSHPGEADDASCAIDPDLYLGPEDDVIDVDELLDSADPPTFSPATSEVSISCGSIHSRPFMTLIVSPKPTNHLPNFLQTSRNSIRRRYV